MRTGAEPDAALIDASRRGDRTAFATVIERYQRAVYAVAFSTVRDHALSDDVAQDTFVAAWQQLGELRDTARLPAWLCGIARNLARAASRRRRREDVGDVGDVGDVPEVPGAASTAPAQTPFDALSDADRDRLIAAALATVPDVYREPLVLFYYEQRSVDDVARTLGITARTANKRLSRGRKHLAERVAAIVEHGLGRRGPRPDLAVGVLAAIGVLGTGSHVDASPSNAEGSTMSTRISLALVLAGATLVGGIGLLAADAPHKRGAAAAAAAAAAKPAVARAAAAMTPPSSDTVTVTITPATGSAAPSVRVAGGPALTTTGGAVVVPDCATAANHLADLSLARADTAGTMTAAKRGEIGAAVISKLTDACRSEAWSENRRICIADADDYDRARIDCTDDLVATPDEVAALPPDQRCDVLAQHIYELANGPDGKYTWFKRKAPEHAADVERLAVAARADLAAECDQMPWSIARRTCVVGSTTYRAVSTCR